MFERFTDRARRVVVLAQEEARMLNHNYIGTEHILLGLIHEGEGVAAKALESLGISLDAVRQQVEEIIGQGEPPPMEGHIPFTPRAKKVLELSLREALQLGHNYIGTEHILLGLIREGDGVGAQVLVKLGADLNRVRQQVIQLLHGYQGKESASADTDAESAPSTSLVLDQFGENLTAVAQKGEFESSGEDPVIGREKEIERVMEVLCKRANYNAVLVGEHGVGKSAVAKGLARKIAKGNVPDTLKDKQLYAFHLGALMGKPGARENFEEELKKVLEEIEIRRDIILFVDELNALVEAPISEGVMGPASILKLIVASSVPIVLKTTPDECYKHVEQDNVLRFSFQQIPVAEPTISHTIEILKELRDRYEAHHRVSITDGALVAAAQLADWYLGDRFLPVKAIDLIDEAGSRMRIRRMMAPPDLREYDEKIAQVRREKESFIDSQDFEKAAAFRDTEKQLLANKAAREKEWQAGDMDLVAEVNEELIGLIAETVSRLSGVPLRRILERHAEYNPYAEFKPDAEPQKGRDVGPVQLLNDQPAADADRNEGDRDKLDSASTADGIASILTASRTSSPFVLAVDGGWGIGKSTLLRQIEARLRNQEKDIVCVPFNAWTAQGGNALEGLIKSVLGKLDPNVLRRSMRHLAQQRGVISIIRIIIGIAARFLGISRLVDQMWNDLAVDPKARNEMRDIIAGMLSEWIKQSGQPGRVLVVFIDDLDRCTDEVVLQVCEAVKLYLDAPGLIFVIACDMSVIARDVAESARGGIGEGRAYLEKIIQVAYKVPRPTEANIRKLIDDYGKRSGVSNLIDDLMKEILIEDADRNPRKIKRVINSFALEYKLNPAWRKWPLDSWLLVTSILLQYVYTPFYDFLVSDDSSDDPIGDFLDYVNIRRLAPTPPPSHHPWWAVVHRAFWEHGITPPDRSPGTGDKLMRDVERLEAAFPKEFPALARNNAFVTLMRSIGNKETRCALRAQLINRLLAAEAVDDQTISVA